MNKFLHFISILSLAFFVTQYASAIEYGQVVRFQCERTGEYLSFDPTVDGNGEYKITVIPEANDDTLWIIKGPLNAPVDGGNPYDRWNCVFGQTVPTSGYNARIEHVITAYDGHFGNYYAALPGHVNPYFFTLGMNKLGDPGAINYYNIVLNLNDEKKILISNEYLCAADTDEAILTQDAAPDTWNIIPVYTMTDDLRTVEGQDLIDALSTPTGSPVESTTDHLIEDVSALIAFYENEVAYRETIKTAFANLAIETDINARILIVQGLESHTTNYNNQKAAIFGTITHPTTSELIVCINDLLIQNKTNTIDLENAIQALSDELTTVNSDLNAIGATSVPDLTDKINQLIAVLTTLWQTT